MVQIILFNLLVFPLDSNICRSTMYSPLCPWSLAKVLCSGDAQCVCVMEKRTCGLSTLHIGSQKEEGEYQIVRHKIQFDSSHCTHSPVSRPRLRPMPFSLCHGWGFLGEHCTLIFTSKQFAPSFLQIDSVPAEGRTLDLFVFVSS